jgi:hypothetical protein
MNRPSPKYITSKQQIAYYVRKKCVSAGDLMFGSHKPGGHPQE